MMLFVWNDVYHVSYGSADLFVIAPSLGEAKKKAEDTVVSYYAGEPRDHRSFRDLGEPDWSMSCPVAFVHEWSE